MDPFLKKKWEHVFRIFFDTDKSQLIDWDDFQLLLDKIKNRRGENSEGFKMAQSSLKAMWDGLSAQGDQDGDNKISMNEWLSMWSAAPKEHLPWQKAYLQFMFNLLDASNDNLIEKPEYIDVMTCYGINENEASQCFDRIAVDRKGNPLQALDFDRFQALWNEFFYSNDQTSPGNFLFGQI